MGVDYCVRTYVADNEDDKGHKRSSVTLAIKKVLITLRNTQKFDIQLLRLHFIFFTL